MTSLTYAEAYLMVSEFHEKFDAKLPAATRVRIIEEELQEFREAYAHFLKEAVDLFYVDIGAEVEGYVLEEELGCRVDRAYHAIGNIDELFRQAFVRVHKSNMSKLGEDGKPIKREDGKILKGPNYFEPDLLSLIPGGK